MQSHGQVSGGWVERERTEELGGGLDLLENDDDEQDIGPRKRGLSVAVLVQGAKPSTSPSHQRKGGRNKLRLLKKAMSHKCFVLVDRLEGKHKL